MSGLGLLSNATKREVPLHLQHLGWLCRNFGLLTKHQARKTLTKVQPAV